MKSLLIIALVLVASLVAVAPTCQATDFNPRIARRAQSRELGRQRAQAAAFGVRGFSHGSSIRSFSSGTRIIILR